MPRSKLDGVIEAVRYGPDGMISQVRTYQRHGAVWSDHVLLDRVELVKQLGKGRYFVTGRRKNSLGGVFETGRAIRMINGHVVTEGQSPQRDLLAGVPAF